MKKSTYIICNTANPHHLNGSITIEDNEDNTGKATINVIERQCFKDREDRIIQTNSIEEIKFSASKWETIPPNHHSRYNNRIQSWTFEENQLRSNHHSWDNHLVFKKYLKYTFCGDNEDCKGEPIVQGNGTGTAGGD